MNGEQQKELEDELPITMQASLMMEMGKTNTELQKEESFKSAYIFSDFSSSVSAAVSLALLHLRPEELYQTAIYLQSKDRQFM